MTEVQKARFAKDLEGMAGWRLWGGHEDDDTGLIEVEAYHESREPGCGGVHISTPA